MQKFRSSWTEEEDSRLISLMENFSSNKWSIIATNMGTRSSTQCMNRWTKILKPGLFKGYWSKEEDDKLIAWVENRGPRKWSEFAKQIQKRSAKQCRERWMNHLDPKINRDPWSTEEDIKIFHLYKKYGTSWSKISKEISGRSENSIKNRFYSTIRSLVAHEKTQIKDKKKVNKNQGFVDVLLEKIQDSEIKEGIEQIKQKIRSKFPVKRELNKKRKHSSEIFQENPTDTKKLHVQDVCTDKEKSKESIIKIETNLKLENQEKKEEKKINTDFILPPNSLNPEEFEKNLPSDLFNNYMGVAMMWQGFEMFTNFMMSSLGSGLPQMN